MSELIYPDLSYKIVGLLFDIYNELGFGYQEKYYQRALKIKLDCEKIKYKKECLKTIKIDSQIIGRYFIDFVIDDKIVVELKIANDFYKKDISQVLGYLKATKLKLGILVIFTKK